MKLKISETYSIYKESAELRLWRALRDRQFSQFEFIRQCIIGDFVFEFVCLERNVVIAIVDGFYDDPMPRSYDIARTEFLNKHNFTILRFFEHEILENLQSVLTIIDFEVKCEF